MSKPLEFDEDTVKAQLEAKGWPVGDVKVEKEESKIEPVEEKLQVEVSEPQELSDVEKEALETGWDPKGKKSAQEWVNSAPLYKAISEKNKELRDLKHRFSELASHVSNLQKAGYQEKVDYLESERKAAVARSDYESLKYYDKQLDQVKQEFNQIQTPQKEAHPLALAFMDKYKDLLGSNPHIHQFVFNRDNELGTKGLSPEEHIRLLEQDLRNEFPNRFTTEKVKPITMVESDSRPVKRESKAKYTFEDLNKDQKYIYKFLERKTKMGGEEYIKQLVETGVLK